MSGVFAPRPAAPDVGLYHPVMRRSLARRLQFSRSPCTQTAGSRLTSTECGGRGAPHLGGERSCREHPACDEDKGDYNSDFGAGRDRIVLPIDGPKELRSGCASAPSFDAIGGCSPSAGDIGSVLYIVGMISEKTGPLWMTRGGSIIRDLNAGLARWYTCGPCITATRGPTMLDRPKTMRTSCRRRRAEAREDGQDTAGRAPVARSSGRSTSEMRVFFQTRMG